MFKQFYHRTIYRRQPCDAHTETMLAFNVRHNDNYIKTVDGNTVVWH